MFTIQQFQDEAVKYVPDFLNNREACEQWIAGGEEGPKPFFTVTLLPMSGEDYARATSQSYRNMRKKPDFMAGAEETVRRIIGKYVPDVEGLAFQRRDGTVAKPTTGRELYRECSIGFKGLGEIIDDIAAALGDISKADEGDLKKLRQRLGGSTLMTAKRQQDEAGDAADATPTSSRTQPSRMIPSSRSHETATAPARD